MSEVPDHKQSPGLARRHVLAIAAAAAGRVAAVTAVSSLPIAALSSSAQAHAVKPDCICFLRGTRILTSKGEARIEDLRIGDLVATERGETMPIKWIGRNFFKKGSARPWPESVQPIRVSRSAIDDQTPHADLYLSPGHALYIDGVLIPVKYFVNGRSITPAMPEGMDSIEYFQIELESHEVIFAEGTPVETFLVTSGRDGSMNREKFTNFVEYERLYGTGPLPAMMPYAPIFVYDGGRAELKALLRLAVSPFIDVRDPIQVVYSRIAARAEELVG
jgi:hypothetical protein